MKIEQAKTLADEALGKLLIALDQGQSEALKAYLATMARFHNYSAGNVLLIAMHQLIHADVPDHDRSPAVLPRRNDALELEVVERVVLRGHGQAPLALAYGGPLGTAHDLSAPCISRRKS